MTTPSLSPWHLMGLAVVSYLGLLARSAWIQGEFRQFLRSLLIVMVLVGAIAGIVALAMALESPF